MTNPSNPYAELPEKLSKLIDERRRYYDVAGDSVEVAMIEAIKAISRLTRDVEEAKEALIEVREFVSKAIDIPAHKQLDAVVALDAIDDIATATLTRLAGGEK